MRIGDEKDKDGTREGGVLKKVKKKRDKRDGFNFIPCSGAFSAV